MRACSPAQAALLANPPPGLCSADLFTFTLRDGVTTYTWTSYDQDLIVNGQVYASRKPWIQRSRWSVANTMAVPTLEVTLFALNDSFAGGLDIKAQLTNGLFDGARGSLDRVFFVAGTTVINDLVEPTLFGTATAVDVASNTAGVPVTLSGFATTDILLVTKPSGLTYQAWSRWSSDGDPLAEGLPWHNDFFVTDASSVVSHYWYGDLEPDDGDPTERFTSVAAAEAAFVGQRVFLTGSTSYTFDIQHHLPITDDRGGLSLHVAQATGGWHAGMRVFGGNVADIDIDGATATIRLKGRANLLDQYAPRNLYQLGCEHAFCDAGCTLSRALFTTSHTVGASPTRTFVPWGGTPPAAPAKFRFGTVTFTSGPCSGQARTVRSADSSGLTLTHPLTTTPVAGDGFTSFEGCDKQLSSGSGQDCTARSNTQNWRAFPFVPPADTAF